MKSHGDAVRELFEKSLCCRERQLRQNGKDITFFFAPIVTAHTLDHASVGCAWILFEHVSIDKWGEAGIWSLATFRYSVWLLELEDETPRMTLQAHVTKQHGEKAHSSYGLATDIDRLALDRDFLYIRDWRLLTRCNGYAPYPKDWAMIPRTLNRT